MNEYYYDLHIHTGLSPCASKLMSPSNIVNMACMKGLDFIAITDHNRALNVEEVINVAKDTDLIVIPGIEVETYEGIHIVCYFETIERLMKFDQYIYDHLPNLLNRDDFFGEQHIYNELDEVIDKENRLLLNSCQLKLQDITNYVVTHGGVVSLAHIDRKKNGILTVLGFIPHELTYHAIELKKRCSDFIQKHHLEQHTILINSDAHDLGSISEAKQSLQLKEKSIDALFNVLRGG